MHNNGLYETRFFFCAIFFFLMLVLCIKASIYFDMNLYSQGPFYSHFPLNSITRVLLYAFSIPLAPILAEKIGVDITILKYRSVCRATRSNRLVMPRTRMN